MKFLGLSQMGSILVAILGMALMTLGTIIAVSVWGAQNPTTLVGTILGFSVLIVQALLAALKQEQAAQEAQNAKAEVVKTRHDIKDDLQTVAGTVRVAAEETKKAAAATAAVAEQHDKNAERRMERMENLLPDTLPKSREELEGMMREIARATAEEVCQKFHPERPH